MNTETDKAYLKWRREFSGTIEDHVIFKAGAEWAEDRHQDTLSLILDELGRYSSGMEEACYVHFSVVEKAFGKYMKKDCDTESEPISKEHNKAKAILREILLLNEEFQNIDREGFKPDRIHYIIESADALSRSTVKLISDFTESEPISKELVKESEKGSGEFCKCKAPSLTVNGCGECGKQFKRRQPKLVVLDGCPPLSSGGIEKVPEPVTEVPRLMGDILKLIDENQQQTLRLQRLELDSYTQSGILESQHDKVEALEGKLDVVSRLLSDNTKEVAEEIIRKGGAR